MANNDNIIRITDLSLSFELNGEITPVLDRVSFSIRRGETVGLVGESGSGKSVTALSILQLHDRKATRTTGRIIFDGRDLNNLTESELLKIRGNRIAMIFQEPMTSLNPVYPVGGQVMESIMIHQGLDRQAARQLTMELFEKTGIQSPERRINQFPHQLSGGQRQRVMIAMALACRPALLIADEPTTALDVTIQAQILQLIKDLQEEMNMAVLLITHDLNMIRRTAQRVNIMHHGRIVESAATEDIFASPRDPYTIHLLESIPAGRPTPKEPALPLLEVSGLECHFPIHRGFLRRKAGVVKAVDGIDLIIPEGTTLGLVGESGSGKSTLGLAILRLISCRGRILYRGDDLLKYSNRRMRPLRREIQVVFQDPFSSLSPRMTIEQIIAEGMVIHKIGRNRSERRKLIEEVLEKVGLNGPMADRFPHEFSGGQRQRIAIARAIVLNPSFLLLDEPTSALDMTIQAQIIGILKDLQEQQGLTYLFISHDLRVVQSLADQIAVMLDGRIVEHGSPEIFDNPVHPYTRQLFKAAFG